MSYINSALRKVQKERDSRYAVYGDVISSCREGSRDEAPAVRSRRVFAFPAAVAFILGILAVAGWIFFPSTTPTVKGSAPVSPPLAAIVAQQSTGPAAAAKDDSPRRDRSAQIYESALAAQRGRRWQEAESLYQQAISIDPRHVQALNNLGVLYMTQKRSEEAVELFVKALAIQSGYVDPYYNLACLYSQSGNIRASLGYLERAVGIDGQVRKWAKQDNDFKKMQSLPEFHKITEELVK
jgi:tetratricopeptide (TPR) repeat protein